MSLKSNLSVATDTNTFQVLDGRRNKLLEIFLISGCQSQVSPNHHPPPPYTHAHTEKYMLENRTLVDLSTFN